ncbi:MULTISPECIES: gluconokinase [Streptomyces]|uniref:Gluconokinase n=1 Tax=Streptomyces lycii TaxID=2654337 RepID=A0ABQ7FAS7_9ACTN|nr:MULTISPECIES: gluconokinase [Streptomyces]KAF4405632.1 gluconokinase [Streptomyces lycii]PGH51194.1 gluconate kinase [Streptomyces sp. Ru87]
MAATDRQPTGEDAPLVVVMGVAGAGKTTIGRMVAGRLGVPYADADDFHPPENIAKMTAGTPLDDEDRRPWLAALGQWLAEHSADGGVVSCSALKRRYRKQLSEAAPGAFFLHLDGSADVIAQRMAHRKGHFMPPSLLRSQIADLQPLERDERGAAVSIDGTPEQTTDLALDALRRAG